MKIKLLLLMLLTTIALTAQTQVTLNDLQSNITLGQNCSTSQEPEQFETENIVLNGHKIILKNSILRINGNITGPGEISNCGNSNSQICISGTISNNIVLDGLEIDNCNTLGLNTFETINDIPKNLNYVVYNIRGQILSKGNTNDLNLPKNTIIILKVENYQVKKLFIK